MKKIALVVLMLCGMLMASASYADGITLQMKDATVIEVATKIASEGNVNIVISKDINGELRIPLIDFQSVTTERALLMLSSAAQLAISRLDSRTYFICKLSPDAKDALRDVHPSTPTNTKTFQPFQYDYPLGSHVQLKNVSVGNLLLVIVNSCRVKITLSDAVDQSEIIQQIDIQQMTPEVAFEELSKATGLIVMKTKSGGYLVTKDAADTAKMLERPHPSIPLNPRERFWPYNLPFKFQ